ncbi:MAG: hypothetical protein ABEK36_03945 [Candidatus Aenigmatarchaeota archaeon]
MKYVVREDRNIAFKRDGEIYLPGDIVKLPAKEGDKIDVLVRADGNPSPSDPLKNNEELLVAKKRINRGLDPRTGKKKE